MYFDFFKKLIWFFFVLKWFLCLLIKDILLYDIFFYLVCFSNSDSKNIILIIINYNEIIKRFSYLFLIMNILIFLWFV